MSIFKAIYEWRDVCVCYFKNITIMATNQQIQNFAQKQNVFLMQKKLQLLHMMHLSTYALEDLIKIELEENPALEVTQETAEEEEDILCIEDRMVHESRSLDNLESYFNEDDSTDYKTQVNNNSLESDKYIAPVINSESFQDQIKNQLRGVNIQVELAPLVNYLIDSLEDDGYLRRSLEDIADDYSFSEGRIVSAEMVEDALIIIQQLEPAGLGARSLQECLILQLSRRVIKEKSAEDALLILKDHFEELSTKNFDKLKSTMHLIDEDLREAFAVISHLSPRPVFVAEKSLSQSMNIIPEFTIQFEGDNLEVSLANNPSVVLRINETYSLQSISPESVLQRRAKDHAYFKRKVDEAKWFIDALQQREKTFLEIIKVIAVLQREYFLSGDQGDLKPMILQDISDKTGYDLSTISRVTSNKYVQTPYGNVLLKNLFSNALIAKNGKEVSVKKIKEVLKEIIGHEDKINPFNDLEIVVQLAKQGYAVARRTIVKYRDALDIPSARMRKQVQ